MDQLSTTPAVNRSTVHRLFYIGVWLKGLTGLSEVLGGTLLWYLNPALLNHFAGLLVRHELSEHPKNFIVYAIRHLFTGWTLNTQHFGAIYLVANGAISLAMAIGLIRRIWWSYPVAATLLSLFVIYQLHRAARTHSWGLLALSVVDIVIVLLILNEYRRGHRSRTAA